MSQNNSSFENDEFISREDSDPNLEPQNKCLGCIGEIFQGNQLAHMDPPHGCLFKGYNN